MDKKQAAKYYSYLKFERNLTDNSVEAYLHDIEKLQKFADNLGKPLEALEQSDIETFLWGLRDVGITPTSQNRILAGIRSYYRFLRLEGELETDPTDCIDSPKLPEHVPTILTLCITDKTLPEFADLDGFFHLVQLRRVDGKNNLGIFRFE